MNTHLQVPFSSGERSSSTSHSPVAGRPSFAFEEGVRVCQAENSTVGHIGWVRR